MPVSSPMSLGYGVCPAAATLCKRRLHCSCSSVTHDGTTLIILIPRTEHIVKVVKLAYLDESIVSQERFGGFCVRGNRIANLHADCIGLR